MRLTRCPPLALALALVACTLAPTKDEPVQFTGKDAPLEQAIAADDPAAVDGAVTAGANVNAHGAHGVTPLSFAVGTMRAKAAAALVRHGADANAKDDEGDNPVTLAVAAYAREPRLLPIVLDAGGDPNTRRPDGSPVIVRFGNDRDLAAMTMLHQRGADVDAVDDGQPLVVGYAISEDWDVVWHLISLGARLDTPQVRDGMIFAFKNPGFPSPDSPLYPSKVKVWQRLKQLGLNPTPPAGM